ncbi:MAG: PAS domain S-box protein [Chitinophagaceae bacterium]
MYHFFTRRNINTNLVIFLALLVFVGTYTVMNMVMARKENRVVNTTLQSLRTLEDVMDDMQDMESGHQTFLISGNKKSLELYYSATARLQKDTSTFGYLISHYPERTIQLNVLSSLIKRTTDLAEGSIRQLNQSNRDSLYKNVKSGRGKQMMDSIRQLIFAFEKEDRAILQLSNAQRELAATRTVRFFVISALLLLICLSFLFWRVKKEMKNRERNEQELSHLASLMEQTSDAVFSTDTEIRIRSWNRAAEEMYDYTAAEAIGQLAGELLKIRGGKEDNTKSLEQLRKQGYYKGDYSCIRKSGNSVYIQASLSVLRNKKNEIEGYVVVHRDITERIRSEELLAKFNEELNRQVQEKTEEINHSNQRFEMISRTTNDAIWEWDLVTGNMWANETHQQFYGLTLADAVPSQKHWEERIHPDERQFIISSLQEALVSDKNVWIAEYRFRTGEEYKYIYDRSYIVRNNKGKAIRILGSMMDVTGAKQAAVDLQESEEKYRSMIEQASDGIFILTDDGGYIDANNAACLMTGYSKEELVKMSATDILPAGEMSMVELKREEIRLGMTVLMERKLVRKDGTFLETDVSYKRLSNGYILAIARDVTERKKAEEALLKSEETRRLIMNSALDAIICIDTSSVITVWSRQAENIFGWKENEAMGQKLTDTIIPVKYREQHAKGIAHYLSTGQGPVLNRIIEISAVNKHGEEFPVELSIIPIQQGGLQMFCAFIRDITARKKAQDQVAREKELSDTAINSLPGIFYMFDSTRKFLRWNKNFETVSGYSPEELRYKVPVEFFAEEDRQLAQQKVEETFQQGTSQLEAHFLTKSGEKIPYFFTGLSVMYEGKLCMVGTGIDITEQKMAEAALKASEEKLRHVLTSSANDFYVIDTSYQVVLINETAAKNLLKNWGKAVRIGTNILDAAPAGKVDYLKINYDKAFSGQRIEYETLNMNEGKPSWVLVSYLPVRDEKNNITGINIVTKDITERKLAEAELKQSNNRFEMITKTTNDAVWEWDLETGQLWSNETHQHLYGLTMKDPVPVEGMWETRIHPDDRDLIVSKQKGALVSGTNVFISEYRFLSGNNEYVNLYDRCYIVRDEMGKPVRMMGSMMDITERKKAEDAVRISEEQYRALVENAPEALVVMDMELRKFVSVSESALKLFKMSREELLEVGLSEVSPEFQPDGRTSAEAAIAPLEEAIRGGKPAFEWIHKDSRGQEITCEVRLVRLPSDKQILVRGSIIDITERKKIETERANERNLLRALIDNLPDYIYVKDTDFNYIISNRAFVKLVGANGEAETMGKKSPELFGPEVGNINTEEDKKIVTTGKEVIDRDEPIITREGKQLWLLTTKVPLKDAEGNVTGILGISKDITERKMAEEEIMKTNARFQSVSKATSDIVWDWDLLADMVWWNDNYYSNLGYRKQKEIVQIGEWFMRIHPEDVERVRTKIRKTIAGKGSSWQDAYRYIKSDGTYLHFLDRGFILRDSGGNAYKMIGSMVDMTPVYEAQKKISESEEKYRTLVEQAVDAIALYDAQGRILDVNSGSVNLLGYEKEELMQLQLSDILTTEEIKLKPVRYDILEQGESTVKQRSMRKKDGTIIQTEVRSQQLPDGRFLSVIRDLTERIKAQEQIEKEKQLSDKLIDSLPGVFYWYDENGRFQRWNRQFEIVTGYTAREIADMHPTDFFEGEGKKHIIERIGKVFTEGLGDAEAEFFSKDGSSRPYYFKAVRIIIDGQPFLLGTGIDISDRKKAELELEESYAAVRKLTEYLQNVREEERTHIAREIHDELGQQLTVLKMDVSWLNKKINPTDDNIKQKMQELLHMLDEVVGSVRRISSELRPSLLDDLGLTAALEWQLKEFEKRSGIKTKFDAPEEEIKMANPVKTALFRIFQESLTNVARHSGAKKLSVSLGIKEGNFVLSIIDDGNGFDKQKLAEKKTLGILGMQERTSMIGGNYKITGMPGKGTAVEVSISLDDVNVSDQLNRN